VDFEEAINERRVVSFTYGGHLRVVKPGALGYHVTTRKLLLRGYQIDGTSSSRTPPFWSLFEVRLLSGPVYTGDTFDDEPPDYRLGDKHLGEIIAEL